MLKAGSPLRRLCTRPEAAAGQPRGGVSEEATSTAPEPAPHHHLPVSPLQELGLHAPAGP